MVALGMAALATVGVGDARAARQPERLADRYIVVYRSTVSNPGTETTERERRRGFRSARRYSRALKGFAAKLTPAQVEELRSDPEVAFVSPDRPVHALATLAAGETAPTGTRRVGSATATTARGPSGVNVAVIDSGVDLDNPDLNAVSGVNCAGAGPADDDNGHGTHVAGTIAARNTGSGVTGVAPGTRVVAVKVLDASGGGTFSQIICGIDWVTSTRTDADPANDIAVANMSLGGAGSPVKDCATTTDPMHRAICASTAAGVTYVVAAGNDGWDFDYAYSPDLPAAYPQVLTVTAASDSDGRSGAVGGAPTCTIGEGDDRYASFSNFAATTGGAQHTIAAPGVCITSTWPGGVQNTISGTSMATPHVTAAVALCLNESGVAGPCAGLSPSAIAQRMRSDAKARTDGDLAYGFAGDPSRPVSGRFYGHLLWAGTGWTAPAVRTVRPAGYAVQSGSVYAGLGAIDRLYANDASRVEISAAGSGSSWAAEIRPYTTITQTERTALKRLTVDFDGNATASWVGLAVRILNQRTGAWVTLDGPRTGVTADRAASWSIATAPADYVSSTGEIRVSVRGTGSSGFRTRTDLVSFRIET
jgi:subtilisin family serine protease